MSDAVTYTRHGDVHTFGFTNPALQKIVIDYTNIPPEDRNGLPKQLLASASLACYTAMLGTLLDVRKAHYSSITAGASYELGPNKLGQGRVKKMILHVTVTLPEAEKAIFERCARIMEKGCLVTQSLQEGIEMSYALDARFAQD